MTTRRPSKATARAAVRDNSTIVLTGFIALMALILAATQAFAQQKGEAQTGGDVLLEGIDLCGLLVDDVPEVEDQFEADGWVIEEVYQNGNFVLDRSMSKIYDDGTDAYIFATLESYPTSSIGYCSFDVQFLQSPQDLGIVLETYDAIGEVTVDEAGYVHGTWQSIEDNAYYLVIAHYEEANDYLFVQMTRVGGVNAGSSAATPDAPPAK